MDNWDWITWTEITGFKDIKLVSGKISRVWCGGSSTFLKLTDGRLMACGNNEYGQLGLGDNTDRKKFVHVDDKQLDNISEVIGGSRHTIIRLKDNTIMGSGSNTFGELGMINSRNISKFKRIELGSKNIDKIVCGFSFTFFKLTDGSLKCCGSNVNGQQSIGQCVSKECI